MKKLLGDVGDIVYPFSRRWILMAHAVLGAMLGFGLLFDKDSFENPAFEAVFKWATPTLWGVFFWISTALAILGIVTGSWKVFRTTNLLTMALTSAWFGALLDARWHLGIVVSFPLLGIWAFAVTTCVVVAAITGPVKREIL